MRHPRGRAITDVFDLDGVLSSTDTFTALLVERLTRAPWRILRALPALVEWLRTKGDVERNAAASRRVATIALRGLDEAEYDALAQRLGRRLGTGDRAVRREVVDRLNALHAAGRGVVVATATERRLAEAFLAAAGARYDLLVASELGWDARGIRLVAHRRAAAKLDALRKQGVDVGACRFYTDSYDDLPTAEAAAAVVLVHPSPRALESYRAHGLPFELFPG